MAVVGSDPETATAPRMSLKSHEAEAPWNRMGDTDDDLRFAAGLLVCCYVDSDLYIVSHGGGSELLHVPAYWNSFVNFEMDVPLAVTT